MVHVWLAIRLTLAGVFLVSALAKVRSFGGASEMCASLLRRLGVRHHRSAHAAAGLLIIAEVATGAALLSGGMLATFGFIAAGLLLCAFALVAVFSARNVVDVRCACFGQATAQLGWRHVWRDLALLAGVVIGLATTSIETPERWNPAGVIVAVAAALVATILTAFYDDIVDIVAG